MRHRPSVSFLARTTAIGHVENLDLLWCLESDRTCINTKKKKKKERKKEEAITALKRDAISLLENLDLLRQLKSVTIGA